MEAQPTPQHQWLKKLIGQWTYENESEMGGETYRVTGTETVRALGDLWILAEGQGDMPDGGSMHSLITLGFDPAKGRFVGTFVASMMAMIWPYEGDLDGNTLTLEAEGPSFSGDGSIAKYRDVIEFLTDDHRTFSSSVLLPDGTRQTFMKAHYRRTG
jgi:hypothetical protein